MTVRKEQTLEPKLNLVKFPINTQLTFELDQTTPWVAELLKEMNEGATDKSPDQWLQETSLKLHLELAKKFKNEEGEYLLVKGQVKATYVDEHVRTLAPLKLELDLSFKAVFLNEPLLQTEAFEELDEIWLDGDTYEIYTYKKATADLGEMIHEQLFLHRIQYPGVELDEAMDGGLDTDKPRQ